MARWYVSLESFMPSFYTIIRSRKLVLRPVKHIPNIQWKQLGSTQCISQKTTNIVIFKIVQYFHAVVCINLLNAITQLVKILDDVFPGNKGKAASIRKWSGNSGSPLYLSWSSVDWICFQMFDDKWKKQHFISTLDNSNCIVFIDARSKSKRISCEIPGTRFEISLKNTWHVCWFLFGNNVNKPGRTRPLTSAWIVYTW